MNQRHDDTALSRFFEKSFNQMSDKQKGFISLLAGFSMAVFMLMPFLIDLYQSGHYVG